MQARSEAREAWHGWRTAYDLARHYRDEIVPLRKFINDETVLRYNGMLASVWDLLGETRNQVAAVNSAIAAQRDFWIADTDLHTALTGTSPGALAAMGTAAEPAATARRTLNMDRRTFFGGPRRRPWPRHRSARWRWPRCPNRC